MMKAVMRALSVAESDAMPVVGVALEKIKATLARVCANPRNPRFNHFLFESIAVLVRAVCGQDGGHVGAFEDALFPPVQTGLQMDVAEFAPCVPGLRRARMKLRPRSPQVRVPGPAQLLLDRP